MKKVTVITINFNNPKDTHGCLDSLFNLAISGIELSIIVVDNASKVPFALTEKEKKKNVFLLRSEKNLGFTGGNNLGMAQAIKKGTDYLLLLNNDTIVDKNLVKELLLAVEKEEKIGAVVPKIYFAPGREYHKDRYNKKDLGKVFWYAGGLVDYNNAYTLHRGVDEVDLGQYENVESVEFATGCCILLKKEILEKVGLFDDSYFLYFEDGDLSQRILSKGYKIMYVPKAILWHLNAGSSGSGSALHDYYLTRNRMIFGMKYMPIKTKLALVRESVKLLFSGRQWQKKGILDYYMRKFGKGSYK